jgi:hypothetical protein
MASYSEISNLHSPLLENKEVSEQRLEQLVRVTVIFGSGAMHVVLLVTVVINVHTK